MNTSHPLINEKAEQWLNVLENEVFRQQRNKLCDCSPGFSTKNNPDILKVQENVDMCCLAVGEYLFGNSYIYETYAVHNNPSSIGVSDEDGDLTEDEFMFSDTAEALGLKSHNGTFIHTNESIEWVSNIKPEIEHELILKYNSLYQMNDELQFTFPQIVLFCRTFPELVFKPLDKREV